MRPSDMERDSFWLDLIPEPQNTEDEEFDPTVGADLAGTEYGRRAAAESPLAQNYTDYPTPDGEDTDLGNYPEVAPLPLPWATPNPPEGLPVFPPDGGLPPL